MKPTAGHKLVYVGDECQRWLIDSGSTSAWLASDRPCEILCDFAEPMPGTFVFFDCNGQRYLSSGALGTLRAGAEPPVGIWRVAAAGSVALGLLEDGHLLRSDDAGAHWHALADAPDAIVDVGIRDGGQALALSMPETLWASSDGGKHFAAMAVPAIGVKSIHRSPSGAFVLAGGSQSLVYQGDVRAAPTLEEGVWEDRKPDGPSPGLQPGNAASANALATGKAAFAGGIYYEVMDAAPMKFGRGGLAGQLAVGAIPALESCVASAVGAAGPVVEIACVMESQVQPAEPSASGVQAELSAPGRSLLDPQSVRFFRSEDSGRHFVPDGSARAPVRGENIFLTLSKEGRVIVTGVSHAGPLVPLLRWRQGGQSSLLPLRLEAFALSPIVRWGPGSTIYVLGRRARDYRAVLCTAKDARASFGCRELSLAAKPGEDGHESSAPNAPLSPDPFPYGNPFQDFTVDAQGRGLITLSTGELTRLDAERGIASLVQLPSANAVVGIAGDRVLAVSTGKREAWESLDRGQSWVAVPHAPSQGSTVRCFDEGCVVGDEVARVGWGEPDASAAPLPRTTPTDRAHARRMRKLATPIVCNASGSWVKAEGIRSLPEAGDADRGNAVWTALGVDEATTSVRVVRARRGAQPSVETLSLLAPRARGAEMLLGTSEDPEGIGAFRYSERPRVDHTAHLQNSELAPATLELAWLNAMDDTRGNVRSLSVTPLIHNDEWEPDLLAVVPGGLFVIPQHRWNDNPETAFFATSPGKIERVEWLAGTFPERLRGYERHFDAAHVGGRFVAIEESVTYSELVRVNHGSHGLTADLLSLELHRSVVPNPTQPSLGWWRRARALLYVVRGTDGRPRAFARAIRADGPVLDDPEAMPTPLDLADPPRACGASDRKTDTRAVMPYEPGTGHPVLISEVPSEPPQLWMSDDSVLYGKPETACLASLEAHPVPGPNEARADSTDGSFEADADSMLLPLDDLAHAWQFRRPQAERIPGAGASGDARQPGKPEPTRSSSAMEYRNLACHFDSQVAIPEKAFTEDGTDLPAR